MHASTIEGWRQDALAGVEQALRRGSDKTAAELRDGAQAPRPECLLEQALEIEQPINWQTPIERRAERLVAPVAMAA